MSILDLFGEAAPTEVESRVEVDAFTRHASAAFDYEFKGVTTFQPWTVPSDLPEDFTIGAIVGSSGTGKSLFLRNFGEPSVVEWEPTKAVISHFDTPEDSVARLSSVGFNSIPSWMKPYHVLSMGEAYRADMARRMGDGAVFDEQGCRRGSLRGGGTATPIAKGGSDDCGAGRRTREVDASSALDADD